MLSRRRFLGGGAVVLGGAAVAAVLPRHLRRALASAPPSRPGFDVGQVKHVVVMMLENRSFDHYFGALAGVRGFDDPDALTLGTGRSVFYQPDPSNPDGYLLPFHLDSATTAAQAIPSTGHSFDVQHACWNAGAMDNWVPEHLASDGGQVGPYTMGYFDARDLPFHYALANSFTICDNYFCSVLGETLPNRTMLMSATIDPAGANGGPALGANGSGFRWRTYPEALENAGVTWKVYQQADNFGCNAVEYFEAFASAPASSPLRRFGMGVSTRYDATPARDPTMAFEEDAIAGTLPTVSWIIPTSTASEHPDFLPAAGANFVASKIDAIAGNPEVWSSTVFILNYDENDGLFDHVPPIVAPPGTAGEYLTAGDSPPLPVGSGFRVPCIIVSPWTAGGYVCSDPFDHTSTLRFIEAVTGVAVPNLSSWRAATFGDLRSAFQPAASTAKVILPSTKVTGAEWLSQEVVTLTRPLPPIPGAGQLPPNQGGGSRPRVGRRRPS